MNGCFVTRDKSNPSRRTLVLDLYRAMACFLKWSYAGIYARITKVLAKGNDSQMTHRFCVSGILCSMTCSSC